MSKQCELIHHWCGLFFCTVMVIITIFLIQGPIGVNSGRIAQLNATTIASQSVIQQLAQKPSDPDTVDLRVEIKNIQRDRDLIISQINFGNQGVQVYSFVSFVRNPHHFFHLHSSESNNIYIALCAGLLGSSLMCLRRLNRMRIPFSSIVSSYVLGGVVGISVLLLVRGTKGVLMSPLEGVVQVETPYGIAFICLAFGLYSTNFLDLIDTWIQNLAGSKRTPERSPRDEH